MSSSRPRMSPKAPSVRLFPPPDTNSRPSRSFFTLRRSNSVSFKEVQEARRAEQEKPAIERKNRRRSQSNAEFGHAEPQPDVEQPEPDQGGSRLSGFVSRLRPSTLRPSPNPDNLAPGDSTIPDNASILSRMSNRTRAFSNAIAVQIGLKPGSTAGEDEEDDGVLSEAEERARYDRQVIDLLDVIDPEVSALSTLSDLQNSLFVPDLGRFVDRSSYLSLSKPLPEEFDDPLKQELINAKEEQPGGLKGLFKRIRSSPKHKKQKDTKGKTKPLPPTTITGQQPLSPVLESGPTTPRRTLSGATPSSEPDDPTAHDDDVISLDQVSIIARGEYLLLPSGLVPPEEWERWSKEEKEELDDYVRHLLHSRKWKVKRGWRGFKNYVKTPLGAFVTVYASLLTLFGAAWVLLLIGWLSAGDKQAYVIEVIDQVLVALFCVVGIGLAPFRAIDTYHMIYIAKYHRKTLRLYAERGISLEDENDLPKLSTEPYREKEKVRPPVLSVEEQAMLIHHQRRFSKSHTFYRPHETATHKAFPLDLLIVVVCLLDFHSLFQIALGSTTWSISYHQHFKHILTSIILSFSISCNVAGGLVIAIGNRRSRKTEVVEERLRKAVTEEAVRRREEKRLREIEEAEHSRHSRKEKAKHKA